MTQDGPAYKFPRELKPIAVALTMMIKGKVCPKLSGEEWVRILSYAYERDYLYFGFEDGKVKVCLIAYRIPEFKQSDILKLPEKEEGKILYVPCAVSFAEDKRLLWRMLQGYRKNHDIDELILFEGMYGRASRDKLKRFKLKR